MRDRQEILRLRDVEKLSEREIANRLEMSPSTVHYWLAKCDRPMPPARRGRTRKTSSLKDQFLYRYSLDHPFLTAVDLCHEHAPEISPDTVRRRLKEKGLKCRVPALKPVLKPDHLQKRLAFARAHLHWGAQEWQRVVFSDEKIFRASVQGPRHVYRPTDRGNRYDPRFVASTSSTSRGNFTIHVWAAFGHGFRALHWVSRRTLNAEYYTRAVLPVVRDFIHSRAPVDWIFMHDCSKIHTAHHTVEWLEANNIEFMADWPPKGADMNPVENLWGHLMRFIPNPVGNREHLFDEVQTLFNGLGEGYFNKLIESMPKRVAQVVAVEGGWSKF